MGVVQQEGSQMYYQALRVICHVLSQQRIHPSSGTLRNNEGTRLLLECSVETTLTLLICLLYCDELNTIYRQISLLVWVVYSEVCNLLV